MYLVYENKIHSFSILEADTANNITVKLWVILYSHLIIVNSNKSFIIIVG